MIIIFLCVTDCYRLFFFTGNELVDVADFDHGKPHHLRDFAKAHGFAGINLKRPILTKPGCAQTYLPASSQKARFKVVTIELKDDPRGRIVLEGNNQ